MKPSSTITILPHDRKVPVIAGRNLLLLLAEEGIALDQACGGQGICGKCRIKVKGKIAPSTPTDEKYLSNRELAEGFRLACGLIPTGGEIVELSSVSMHVSPKHQTGFADLPIDPWPGMEPSDHVLAVDMGTTTVMGHLLDPAGGRLLSSAATANGQAAFGADVMTRLAYASHGGARTRRRLQALAFDNLGNVAGALSVAGRRIRHVVAVMNTAMTSFMLNWDPDRIGRYPIRPPTEDAVKVVIPHQVSSLAGADLNLPPVIGGFVGSDTVAALYASQRLGLAPPYLIMDIGTNAEVVLVGGQGISACSCAAGPAFEGHGIQNGMRAMEGAIHRVSMHCGVPEIEVIGDTEARGITGSGLISLLGGLLRAGALDRFGMILPAELPKRIVFKKNNNLAVKLTDGVSVSQQDIQQLMLAKAAARAGAEVLLAECLVQAHQLNGLILCGTFAGKLDVHDVLRIGLVPPVDPSIIHCMGNAAAEGAAMMACSYKAFKKAGQLARQTRYVGLSGNPDFKGLFEDNVCFDERSYA